jgi:hypothetical protein
LKINKLQKKSEVLNVLISFLFAEKASQIIHENKGDNAQANIGTFVQQDKDIASLKEEIAFLHDLLNKK